MSHKKNRHRTGQKKSRQTGKRIDLKTWVAIGRLLISIMMLLNGHPWTHF